VNLDSVRAVLRYLVRHPGATRDVIRVGWRFRGRGWWYHPPFLPVVPGEYWQFRVATAAGDHRALSGEEIVRAASWAARQRVGR